MDATKVYIYLENDVFLTAKVYEKKGTYLSPLVVNRSMVGYESAIIDPLNANKIIVFSMLEIGIVGINESDRKSDKI
ncbi:carbamoyl-phosphate synthase domain-containing protein [Campylobacter blaseri]|uniref:Carbamoyl-phosphate synthase small subunit N-terminal domain-containing protein n=1 Tax=Campylobacter blaseri TaxID=2042961 RepID=A0A2P8QZH2_9BACT|nr:carbamoyl-phosphate synthase domain-containing protein [Campylobacter blaseri]PSM51641.1 hypothetical protein CQ405_07555 [Campylobacter blaseri]PSM53434.1 hypothetical protein CRN67_07560 [Campylobacter blaseri]